MSVHIFYQWLLYTSLTNGPVVAGSTPLLRGCCMSSFARIESASNDFIRAALHSARFAASAKRCSAATDSVLLKRCY
jgi:hypothetical protein